MTKTDIANFAFGILGTKRILDLDDQQSKNARYASLHYDQCRREVLRRHRWNFALQRKRLSMLADTPEFGFNYKYALPTDYIRIDMLNEVGVWDYNAKSEYFEVEGDNDGLYLLTSLGTAKIRYVSNITNVDRFDPLFITAFSTLLASRCARAITGSDAREQSLKEQFETMDLVNATQVDAAETGSNENHPIYDALRRSPLVRSRSGSLERSGSAPTDAPEEGGIGTFTVS